MVHLKSRTTYSLEGEEPERVTPGHWAGRLGHALAQDLFLDQKHFHYISEVIMLFMNFSDFHYFPRH